MYHYQYRQNTEKLWEVYENATDQVIKTFQTRSEAAKLSKFLSRGGGFWGFTPAFFLKELQL